jgi:hypothetical protein
MKYFIFLVLTSISITLGLTSCSDDEESAPITGAWEGTHGLSEAFIPGVPVAIFSEEDDDFNTLVTFHEDGTVTVVEEDEEYEAEGTWEFKDGKKQIQVSGAFPENEIFEPTETFAVKELTNTKLVLYLEKTMTLDTDDGEFEGEVQVTFEFARID